MRFVVTKSIFITTMMRVQRYEKYSDYLSDKEKEKVIEIPQYTDNDEVNELRQLVEDCTQWMSIGTYSKVVSISIGSSLRTNIFMI